MSCPIERRLSAFFRSPCWRAHWLLAGFCGLAACSLPTHLADVVATAGCEGEDCDFVELVAGDFDGDGNVDLAGITSSASLNIRVSVEPGMWTATLGSLASLVTGDFDGDGHADLAGVNSTGKTWYMTDLSEWNQIDDVNMDAVASGDLDGDGTDDLVGLTSQGDVWITLDRETWEPVPKTGGLGALEVIATGDLDGDGDDDLVGSDSAKHIWYSTDLDTWTSPNGMLDTLVTGDFDGDGDADLAGVNVEGENTWCTTNLTDPVQTDWANLRAAKTAGLVVGDFDGDGHDDLAGLTGSPGEAWVATELTTDPPTVRNIPGLMRVLAAGDFDGDGDADLAGVANTSGRVCYSIDSGPWLHLP